MERGCETAGLRDRPLLDRRAARGEIGGSEGVSSGRMTWSPDYTK